MTTLAEIKRAVAPGQVYDVTNHFITREDHPSYGTTTRTVTRVTSALLYMAQEGRKETGIHWPKASQIEMDEDGTIRFYGGGAGQPAGDLFLTLVLVHEPGFGDGGYVVAQATGPGQPTGRWVATFYGEYVGDAVDGYPDEQQATAALAARIAEMRTAPGYANVKVPCWRFDQATDTETPITLG